MADARCEGLASWRVEWELRECASTVVRFFEELIDTFSMVDFVVISLCRIVDHADLVMFVDEVAFRWRLAEGVEDQGDLYYYPSDSKSAGKTGSLGRLSERRRNMLRKD